MAIKFANNAATTLASGITNSATSISVQDGSVFPSLGAGDHTYLTFDNKNGTREIVKLTAISGNTLTVVRGQDGTAATSFNAADSVELRLTAALLDDASSITLSDGSSTDVYKTSNTLTFTGGTGVTTTVSNDEVTFAIGQSVGTADSVTFDDVTVTGDLTVSGTTTTVNTETILLADNVITLNSNETGTPSENAGVEVERGTSDNTVLRWNETSDKWELTEDGTNFYEVINENDIGTSVQAYDADTAKYDDVTANFTGTLQNGGSDVVVDTDIGSTVLAYDSNLQSFVSTFTLPTADSTSGYVLQTDGSGTLSFIAQSSYDETTVNISGGSINGTTIGSTTASTGNFSTLSINGTAVTATAAELNYSSGVTSNIQTQLNAAASVDTVLALAIALG